MLLYCLKCGKNTESKNKKKEQKLKNNAFYQNVQCVMVENQNLLKSKKLVDC